MNSAVTTLVFFNNKGGVGKTSLVYHLAWMFADLGIRVVAADLDPQANLTAAFLEEDCIEELWSDASQSHTVFQCLQPLRRGIGDIGEPTLQPINDMLALLVGDLALSSFEDQLSEVWPKCLDGDERSFRVVSAFWRILQRAAGLHQAQVVLVDVGPNLGAINRAALIASDHVIIPLAPDLFSLQGLRNLGPTLRAWRAGWQERLRKRPQSLDTALPRGDMQPSGYVVLQHSVRLDRPVRAFDRWIARIPPIYGAAVLGQSDDTAHSVVTDPHCLALLKHFHSLIPMAQEARKPVFHLKPADGAIGAHLYAAREAGLQFKQLADAIARRTGVAMPPFPRNDLASGGVA
jgi:chromosome partitioning protein